MTAVTLEVLAKLAEKKLKVVKVPLQVDTTLDANGNVPAPHVFCLGEFDPHELDQRLSSFDKDHEAIKDMLFAPLLVAASLCNEDRKWLAGSSDEILQLARQLEPKDGKGLSGIQLNTLALHARQLNMLTEEQIAAIEKKLPKTQTNGGSGGSPSN